MYRTFALVFVVTVLWACGKAPNSDAQRGADQLTGANAVPADTNPVCKLFGPDELEPYAGEPLQEGKTAAMGSGCQWLAKDDDGDVLIQIVPKDYHRDPSLADGYRELPDIGVKGNVTPDMGGWIAAAIVGEESVIASVAGQGANADQAVALLRETIKRRG